MIYESKWCEIDYDTGKGSHFLATEETLPSLVRLLGLTEATLVRKVQIKFTGDPLVPRLQKVETKAE
jgi:hypothetical protein